MPYFSRLGDVGKKQTIRPCHANDLPWRPAGNQKNSPEYISLTTLIFTVNFRVMHTRTLKILKSAFFLFGPRGVGKSTWVKENFQHARVIDLLPPAESLKYAKDPSLLSASIKTETRDTWIVIDEIQKVPALLDEVHHLMENEGYERFALTGSSARKLKRGAANLLGGRAIVKAMYPFTSRELDFQLDPETVLQYGLLPLSVNAEDEEQKEAFLRSYLVTYINEEVKAEGFVRNIGHFSRFLDIAALVAGTRINVSGLARDAGIGRDTVQGYFSIFEDTLLGSYLPAYKPRAKIKEVSKPKFYWFDPGVLNVAAGAFDQPMPKDWHGVLLEHWIHHELQAYLDYGLIKGSLGYWRTPSGSEVDFIWWYGDKTIGIEVKSSKKFRKEYLKGLKSLKESMSLHGAYLVYPGSEELLIDDIRIMPVMDFLRQLHEGRILG